MGTIFDSVGVLVHLAVFSIGRLIPREWREGGRDKID